jgi:hypothetical protein
MSIEILTPIALQQLLMTHGYALPKYGADGDWGGESAAACEAWFERGDDLALAPGEGQPGGGILVVPDEWMPACAMDRIIVHWTAGSYTVSATDRECYHIIVGGDGSLYRGDNSIKANVSTNDADGYAAHTKSLNTGSIGISAACMAGAIESPFQAGGYPLLKVQWAALAAVAADLCRTYDIPVTPETVLQHGEVQANLGVQQNGKWDINKLPWRPDENAGDLFRRNVSWLLEARR